MYLCAPRCCRVRFLGEQRHPPGSHSRPQEGRDSSCYVYASYKHAGSVRQIAHDPEGPVKSRALISTPVVVFFCFSLSPPWRAYFLVSPSTEASKRQRSDSAPTSGAANGRDEAAAAAAVEAAAAAAVAAAAAAAVTAAVTAAAAPRAVSWARATFSRCFAR